MKVFTRRGSQPEKIKFYYKDVISSIYGVLLEMTPYVDEDRLQDIDDILLYVIQKFFALGNKDRFPKLRYSRNPFLYMEDYEFKLWLDETLKSCPQFEKLNLSYNEIEEGIAVDDPYRPEFTFTSGYAEDNEDSWKDDFIDLDAALGNIHYEIMRKLNADKDCITCEYNKEGSEKCKTCTLNPNYDNRYHHINRPFGDEIMRWCSKGCPEGIAVCCYDCQKNGDCSERCCASFFNDEESIKCNSMVFREDETNG